MLIKRPHITEKTMSLVEKHNQYVFEVAASANKISAAKELEDMFGVKVVAASVQTRLGKIKNFGKKRIAGKRSDMKLMCFTLKEGDKIASFIAN